ncbi:MAG: glycosyltransferase family 2 protein [Minisyncoccia bacterium]
MHTISIAVPVFNEEKNVPELLKRLPGVLNRHTGFTLGEIVFVDDGSSDRTLELLREGAQTDARIKILSFSRNFGHQIAVSAALDHVTGDAVAIIDGDLQDPPEFIPELAKKWLEGYAVVYAVRRKRKENIFKRAAYSIFYNVLRRIAEVEIPLDTGDFAIIDRKVVDVIKSMPEHSRFIRGLRAWSGFRSVGIEYERHARFAGEPKYTLKKLIDLAASGVIGFSTVPLRVAAYIGLIMTILSFIVGIGVIVLKLVYGSSVLGQGWASLMLAIFFIGGMQMFMLGVIGEYIGRTYREVQGRPHYIVKEKIGFDS